MRPLRASLCCFALAALIILLWAGGALGYTISGGDAVHRTMTSNVLNEKPGIVPYIESVWPLSVRICYGGMALPGGRMDVNLRYVYPRYTWQVSHELGHQVQLAADAPGGYPAIGPDWLQLLRDRGFPDSVWNWSATSLYNPWEAFAENVIRAYYSPYYTGRTTPNTCLVWLSRADMTSFLLAHGCDPYGGVR